MRTEIVIDDRAVVFDSDCTGRTILFALFASDAGILAGLACIRALVAARTEDSSFRFLRNHRDDVFGTFVYAQTAADTAGGIDSGNAILHTDRVVDTDRSTVSASETSPIAYLGAAADHRTGSAGIDAAVNGLFGCCLAGSVAVNECDHILGFLDLAQPGIEPASPALEP